MEKVQKFSKKGIPESFNDLWLKLTLATNDTLCIFHNKIIVMILGKKNTLIKTIVGEFLVKEKPEQIMEMLVRADQLAVYYNRLLEK